MPTEQSMPRSTPDNSRTPSSSERRGVGDRIRQRITAGVGTQTDRAVEGLMNVASAVRRMGEPLQGQRYEPAVKYVNNAAERVEQAAMYLRQHEVNEVVDDIRAAARRRPAVFIGAGLLAGAIAGRFLKSTSRG